MKLIECDYSEARVFWCNALGYNLYNPANGLIKTPGKYLKPVEFVTDEQIETAIKIKSLTH